MSSVSLLGQVMGDSMLDVDNGRLRHRNCFQSHFAGLRIAVKSTVDFALIRMTGERAA